MATAKPLFTERKKKKLTQLISTGNVCWQLWVANGAATVLVVHLVMRVIGGN